jgi:hypothetical protein
MKAQNIYNRHVQSYLMPTKQQMAQKAESEQ